MRILVDFDETIVHSTKVIFNIIKEETGYDGEFVEDYGWNFDGLLPKEYVNRAIELFGEKVFYDNLYAFESAIGVLEELSESHEVVIVTKHNEKGRLYKTQWIEDNLPFATLHYTETFDKSEVEGDVIIDDKIECLESVKGLVKHRICYGDYGWNKDWCGVRCTHWEGVYLYIKELECKGL